MSIRKNKERNQLDSADFREVDKEAKDGFKFKDVSYAWKNGGVKPDGQRLTMKDALAMWEAPLFIPKVVNNAIQEAVEPLLIATNMLTRIPYTPGMVVDLPVMGAIDGDFDVGEEESFPELRISYGGGSAIAAVGKQGVAIRFTEEILRYSQFDVVSMAVRQAARALARNKEEKIFNLWYQVAQTTHDNSSPLESEYGTTTGMDMTGAQNGSVTMDDIFEMWAAIMHNGYVPDTLLLHPLTWLMFVQDAQLRAFAQMNQSAFFGSQWTGSPAQNDFQSYRGGMGASGSATRHHPNVAQGNPAGLAQNPDVDVFSPNMTSAPNLPGYAGLPFRVVVSPFVPYNAVENTTTILMADSNELGFYVEDHPIQMSEWTDPESDILKIKMKERFLIREKNRGRGLAVAKNVVVTSNKVLLPAQSVINMDGSISGITRNNAI